MKRGLLLAGLIGLLAGCGTDPAPDPAPPSVKLPSQPAPGQPPRVSRPRPPAAQPPDLCGARELQYLVGRPRTEIPIPIDPSRRRVTCTTCPVTMDYREDRLNILFDTATGVIREVKCG